MQFVIYFLSIAAVWGASTFGAISMGIGEIYFAAVVATAIISIANCNMN